MTLVFSLFFSLLEAARVQGLKQLAKRSVLLELESAFGEYQINLWKDYHLLFLDGGNASGEWDPALLEGNWMKENSLAQKGTFAEISERFSTTWKRMAELFNKSTPSTGFSGSSLVSMIQAVQIGVLLAWSYIESVLDVRCLLSGGSVPLVKKVNQWKSDISLGEEVLEKKEEKSESHKEGFDYREYLQILLLLVKEETLVQRAMDIVEQNVRLITPSFRMNHQIHGMRLEGLYAAQPLFMKFITNAKSKEGSYHFKQSKIDFYLSYDE